MPIKRITKTINDNTVKILEDSLSSFVLSSAERECSKFEGLTKVLCQEFDNNDRIDTEMSTGMILDGKFVSSDSTNDFTFQSLSYELPFYASKVKMIIKVETKENITPNTDIIAKFSKSGTMVNSETLVLEEYQKTPNNTIILISEVTDISNITDGLSGKLSIEVNNKEQKLHYVCVYLGE